MTDSEPQSQTETEDDVNTIIPGSGPNAEEMANDFFPGKDQWDGKTILDPSDPYRVAVLRNYDKIIPEMDHWQPVFDDYLDTFVVAQTSVLGEARNQIVNVLKAIFGVNDEDEDVGSAIMAAFGAEDEDD